MSVTAPTVVTVKSSMGQQYRQEIQAGSRTFYSDAPVSKGGLGQYADPSELLLAAWGACTTMTLQMFAKRVNWPLEDVKVTMSKEGPEGQPPTIRKHIEVSGALTPQQLNSLKKVAEQCPVNLLVMDSNKVVDKSFQVVS